MSTLFHRRVEQEWRLLQLLASTNPEIIEALSRTEGVRGEIFSFMLRRTPALIGPPDNLESRDSHAVTLHFPEFFPSVPIEASLACPVFHPNVHPENGFVCLWGRFSPGDTVMEAVSQLQQVITWKLVNEEANHRMQPEALAWYKDGARKMQLPLAFQAIIKPVDIEKQRTFAVRPEGSHRRRLE